MSDDQAYGVAAGELRQFIKQYEQHETEKKDVIEQQKEPWPRPPSAPATTHNHTSGARLTVPAGPTPRKENIMSDDQAYGVAAGELRQFIEQYEQHETEKKDVIEQQKELMAEAKARGYDTAVMRKIIAMRKRDKDDIAEEEAVLSMYLAALGMV